MVLLVQAWFLWNSWAGMALIGWRVWQRTNGISVLQSQWRASRHPCCTAVKFALLAPSPAVPGRCTFYGFQRLEPALPGRQVLTFDGRLVSRTQRILDLDLAALLLSATVSFPGKSALWVKSRGKKGLMKSICSAARNKSFSLSRWNSIGLCRWWHYGNGHWHQNLTKFWAS